MHSRHIISLFFLVIFFTSVFSTGIISINFYFNQNYIATHLCENREKPLLHCNGKCVLQKKLTREANKDQQTPERKSEKNPEVNFINHLLAHITAPAGNIVKRQYPVVAASRITDASSCFFHPPQLFV